MELGNQKGYKRKDLELLKTHQKILFFILRKNREGRRNWLIEIMQ